MRVQLQYIRLFIATVHPAAWSVLAVFFSGLTSSLVFQSFVDSYLVASLAVVFAVGQAVELSAASCQRRGSRGGSPGRFKCNLAAAAPSAGAAAGRRTSASRRLAAVMAMIAAAILTLDLPDPQVLVYRPGDADGVPWHHIVLLKRMQAGVWVGLNPRLGLENIDLNATDHVVLDRLSTFPVEQADQTLAHDPLSKATLEGFKRRAATTAAILGGATLENVDSVAWHVADSSHSKFGESVDNVLMTQPATGMAFTRKGVVILDGEEVFVERVYSTDLETWRKERGLGGMDRRLNLPVRTVGKKISLAAAFDSMTEPETAELPMSGDMAAHEFLGSIIEGPGNLQSYHTEWLRLSGVHEASSTAHVHRTVMETIRLFAVVDGLNCPRLAGIENLVTLGIQTEVAVQRNPRAPDYRGLDLMSGAVINAGGRAQTQKYSSWLHERLKERATLWKGDRLYRKEHESKGGKGKGYGKGDEDTDSEEEITGRKKKKKKKTKGNKGDKGGKGAANGADDG